MRHYRVETPNFYFDIFAQDYSGFVFAFKQAWHRHCKQFRIPVDYDYLITLLNDHQHDYVECIDGEVYRDREVII